MHDGAWGCVRIGNSDGWNCIPKIGILIPYIIRYCIQCVGLDRFDVLHHGRDLYLLKIIDLGILCIFWNFGRRDDTTAAVPDTTCTVDCRHNKRVRFRRSHETNGRTSRRSKKDILDALGMRICTVSHDFG